METTKNTHSILIVEDNHGIRKLFEYILEREGYKVRGVETAAECYAHLKEEIPDLILMDNALPDGSGLEILKEISLEEKFNSTVKLLISGEKTTREDRKMGLDAGAVDYMLKPIREDDLIARVRLIFKVRDLEKSKLESERKLNAELQIKNKELKESENRFKIAFRLSSDYAYAYDVTEDIKFKCDWVIGDFEKVTGYSSHEIMEAGSWQNLIFSEDKEIALERVEKLLSNNTDISEFRIVRKDEQILWVREYCMPVWDEQKNRIVKIYGACVDITNIKENEQKLSEKYAEIDKFNKLMVGRENKMLELKKEINELNKELGKTKRYNAPDEV